MGCGPAADVAGTGVDGADVVRVGQKSKGGPCALTQEAGEGSNGPWVSAAIGPWEQLLQGGKKRKQGREERGGSFKGRKKVVGDGRGKTATLFMSVFDTEGRHLWFASTDGVQTHTALRHR